MPDFHSRCISNCAVWFLVENFIKLYINIHKSTTENKSPGNGSPVPYLSKGQNLKTGDLSFVTGDLMGPWNTKREHL